MKIRPSAVAMLGLLILALAAVETSAAFPRPGRDKKPPPGTPGQEPPEEGTTVKAQGKVVDGDGGPLSQAQVKFKGPKSATVWAGSDGTFKFEGPTGDYSVTVTSGGKSQTFPVTLSKSGLDPSELVFKEE